jgi:beta-carotene hydroxylase
MLKRREDLRQLATVAVYLSLLAAMYFVPGCRSVWLFVPACAFSFLTAVVNHNQLHQGMFRARWANDALRMLLSFAALYPVSANVPAHNLVHHQFEDDGAPDWADPSRVSFRWNLLNLIHFPNVIGPVTFAGVLRWKSLRGKSAFRAQYLRESVFAFGLTGLLLAHDFWSGLYFIVLPQLWGARWFLRINLIQHDGCQAQSDWNHSRNFTGRVFNWFMLNNGFHTIHHNKAGLHWSELAETHQREVAPRIDPRLEEPSLLAYLGRTYLVRSERHHASEPMQPEALCD